MGTGIRPPPTHLRSFELIRWKINAAGQQTPQYRSFLGIWPAPESDHSLIANAVIPNDGHIASDRPKLEGRVFEFVIDGSAIDCFRGLADTSLNYIRESEIMMLRNAVKLLCAASFVALSAPATIANAKADELAIDQSVTTQLPRNAAPTHYRIHVTPDSENLTFKASAEIDFVLSEDSTSITLNAADLTFESAAIRLKSGQSVNPRISVDPEAQTVTFAFGKTLPAGNGTLLVEYTGKISQQANGLFALDYKNDKGEEKRSLFTQFEAPDARRFVPSWDEPNYKATFDLKATVPANQMAVSNMPGAVRDLGNGKAEVTFSTSPKMSTYLLFFGLGEFDRISKQAGSTEVGIVTSKGNGEKGRYALDASAKIVDYYDEYFGFPYPLPKLDNIAGPGEAQFFGAMENWGAIFTFEGILLIDPKITSASDRQFVFLVDAHEIAHQWFGNLVTMQWWDDLWLNEGFASWMESKTTVHFNPEWQAELDRVYGQQRAMGLDAYVTTHPVIQTIKTVEQTNQAFDAISYSKGQAVITMLEGYAGDDVWRNGIRSYLTKHAYGNTKTDDLWNEVEAAGAANLTKIAHDFTKQPGVPLITVEKASCVNGSTSVSLAQGEFSRDRKAQTDVSPLRWNVPVIAQIVGHDPVSNIVSDGAGKMTLPGCGTLLVNAGQSGYYRTLYKPDQIAALLKDFGKLSDIDQAGLLSDSRSLADSEYQGMNVPLEFLDAVPTDASRRVTEQAVRAMGDIFDLFHQDPATQAKIVAIANDRYSGHLSQLGMVQKVDDEVVDANLRSSLIKALGRMGNAGVKTEGNRLFAALESDPNALDGPLRASWLSLIAYNADQSDWDKIRKLGQDANSAVIKSTMYRLLGSTKDPMLATQALELALTDEPGPTISASIIGAVANEHPELAVEFVLANQEAVMAIVDSSSRSRYVATLASGSDDVAMPAKLDAYAKEFLTAGSRSKIDEAISSIETRLKTQPRVKAGVIDWLDK